MSTFRFALLAIGMFVLGFGGFSWANKGFQVTAGGSVPLKPDPRIPTFEQRVEQAARESKKDSRTPQSDHDAERERLRQALLKASKAYESSPCSASVKRNFVTAVNDYSQAWHAMAFCRPGTGGCPNSMDARLDTAAATFRTPAHLQAHKAARAAVRQGGVSFGDFPSTSILQRQVMEYLGIDLEDDSQRDCHIRVRKRR